MFVQGLFVCLVLSSAHGSFNVDSCTDGPLYWCKSFHTAKQCGKINECKTDYWTKSMQDDEVCTLCKDAIGAVADYLKKNGTKEMVESALMKICRDVPIPDLSKDCTQVITEDFDMLYDEIVVLIDNGDLVCGALGLCKSSLSENDVIAMMMKNLPNIAKEALQQNRLPEASVRLVQSDDCSDCQSFITDVQTMLKEKSKTVDEWSQTVKTDCDALGPGLDEICRDQVDEAIRTIINDVSSDADTLAVCKAMEMCGFRKPSVPVNDQCTDCKRFIDDFKSMISQNNTIINKVVNGLAQFYCIQKPAFLQKQCTRYVAMVIRSSINRLIQKPTSEICADLYFCAGPQLISLAALVQQSQSNGDDCKDCTTFLTDLQGVAAHNKTIVTELTNLAKEQCSKLPIGLSELCKDQISTVESNLLPQFEAANVGQLCQTIQMCPTVPPGPFVGGDLCNDCVAFAQDWKAMIQANETMVRQFFDQAATLYCNQLPFFQSECDNVVDGIINQLINEISLTDAHTICAAVYFCPASKHLTLPEENSISALPHAPSNVVVLSKDVREDEKVSDPVTCVICRIVVHELDKILEGNRTTAAVVAALDKVCSVVPHSYEQECRHFVDTYGKEVIEMLINEVESGLICSALLLCSEPEPRNGVTPTETCDLCVVMAQALDNIIEKPATEEKITAALDKVCSMLPSKYEGLCTFVVQEYTDKIIDAILKGVPPEKLCSTIGVCKSSTTKENSAPSPAGCTICKIVLKEIDTLLENNRTEEAIIHAVQYVCDVVPADKKAECDNVIQEYGAEIIKLLVGLVPTEEICTLIKLCASTKVEIHPPQSSELCTLCELVATELDQLLNENSTQQDIEAAVEKVCSILPKELKSQCDDFITSYGRALIELLAQEAKPGVLCPALNLCPKKLQEKSTDSTLCDVCKTVITFVDQEIAANATREDIEKALMHVCANLPAELQDTCDDIVKQYTPEILDLIDNIFDPDYVCMHLRLCSNSAKKLIFGTDHCTYGPSYWCQNEQTARECGALTHCRLHVWN